MSKDKFASMTRNSEWAEEFTPGDFKALGVFEALGLILPAVLGIAPILVPIAASDLTLYMAGAMATRLRRGEYAVMMGDFVFLARWLLAK
ncbi:DoxX family protein [Pendulispora brunnea]|uniref:DoxX family protein n=2 Tax=Pendulispora brunnea TaxID=2905690 RepID=A0ABZ2K6M5_9BACT